MSDDRQILEKYVETSDHLAFREVLDRYLPLVHSVATRVLNGDAHAAEDVCQVVFSKLARRAHSVPQDVILAGWLHRDTYQTALSFIRQERRRKERESIAMQEFQSEGGECDWQAVRPILDEVLNELPMGERDAILLRFFERLSLDEIGKRLQLGESGVSRRIGRALESLRRLLARRGITTTATALSVAMTLNAVQAAPAQLAVKLMSVVPALTPASASIIFMATKVKLLVGAATIVAVGVGIGIWNSSVAPRVESENLSNSHRDLSGSTDSDRPTLRRTPVIAARASTSNIASAFEKLREVLFSPGRDLRHPSQNLRDALLAFGTDQKLALPLLQEALRNDQWEPRRRSLAGLALLGLGAEGAEAVPDVLRALRESTLSQDAFLAATALEMLIQSPLTDRNTAGMIVPDLIQTIRENPAARTAIANLASTLVEPGSPDGASVAEQFELLLSDPDPEVQSVAANALAALGKGDDHRILRQATKGLTSSQADDRVRGLATLMNIGTGATNAIPALRAFLARPQRHDIRFTAQTLLEQLDPLFQQERAASEEERTMAFTEALKRGEASVDDALIALTDLPKAAPAAAIALGSLDMNDFRDDPEFVLGAVTTLRQIACGNLPLETRLAASHAYGQLQPTSPRPIYSLSELANTRVNVEESLSNLPEHKRTAAQAAWSGVWEFENRWWTSAYKRTGEVTDIPSANLAGFAQQIRSLDETVYSDFVKEMQKVDRNFSHYLSK